MTPVTPTTSPLDSLAPCLLHPIQPKQRPKTRHLPNHPSDPPLLLMMSSSLLPLQLPTPSWTILASYSQLTSVKSLNSRSSYRVSQVEGILQKEDTKQRGKASHRQGQPSAIDLVQDLGPSSLTMDGGSVAEVKNSLSLATPLPNPHLPISNGLNQFRPLVLPLVLVVLLKLTCPLSLHINRPRSPLPVSD